MAEPEKLPENVPFSISCYDCDCASPESMEQAIREGWTEIQFTPDGLAENFLGYCPEHSAEWQADLKKLEG